MSGVASALGITLACATVALSQNPVPATPWPFGPTLDFGVPPSRGEQTDTLWLTNPTVAPFAIENVRSNCGCTAVDWPRAPVAPGDTVAIAVAFRCTRGAGPTRRHLDVWLSHLRRRERVYVYADCPPRG